MKNRLIELVEETSLKKDPPHFEIGDQVDVHQRILEGEKERTQVYSGTVIGRKGEGMREMFTVRRIVQGEGVERKFTLHSPKIGKVVVQRSGIARRAKLYYLRDRSGKAVRLKERFPVGKTTPTAAKAAKAERRATKAAAKKAKADAAAAAKAES